MSQTVLQLDNVEFRRNRRVIITDVNLTIHAGERWVLFGPNGIGKSTAVGMLATRTFPSEGRVFILGHQLGKYDVFKLRTRIGLASADLGRQFPEFEDPLDAVVTGLSAVTGRWRDTYTDEEYARARQLLRDFRVSYLEGKEMWRLSEGERTRVLIARALMGDPELLIMDEPTTGLDLGGREQVMRTLSRIGEESSERAVVLVTHKPSILNIVDNIIVMQEGQIALSGPRQAVLEKLAAMRHQQEQAAQARMQQEKIARQQQALQKQQEALQKTQEAGGNA